MSYIDPGTYLLIFQICIIFFLVTVLVFILKARYSLKQEKRFSKYTIKKLNSNSISIMDNIYGKIGKLIVRLSKVLGKSKFLVEYSKKYEKHIKFDNIRVRKGIDFLSIKILIGSALVLLYIANCVFEYSTVSIITIIICFCIGFFSCDAFLYISYMKKQKEISDDLLKSIIVMNNAFKSGKSITQAIKITSKELNGAISDEFKKISNDLSYGLSLETAFQRFYERVQIEDAKYITTSLALLNKTGGNIVKIFDSIEKEYMNRKKLQNELKGLTATSTFVFKTLLAMPFILFLIIYILNQEYFMPLYTTSIGRFVLLIICLIYFLYIVLVKNILRIDL